MPKPAAMLDSVGPESWGGGRSAVLEQGDNDLRDVLSSVKESPRPVETPRTPTPPPPAPIAPPIAPRATVAPRERATTVATELVQLHTRVWASDKVALERLAFEMKEALGVEVPYAQIVRNFVDLLLEVKEDVLKGCRESRAQVGKNPGTRAENAAEREAFSDLTRKIIRGAVGGLR